VVREEVEEIEGVMGDESGGLSANKGVAQEDEGNTTPFPERVCVFLQYFMACKCFRSCLFGWFLGASRESNTLNAEKWV